MFNFLKSNHTYAYNFDLEVIADPTLLVNTNAEVMDCNSAFSTATGWKKELIVKENVFMFVPYQIINKKAHDEKIKNYKIGQKSNFVGHEKMLPIKDANENVVLCQVRILPLQQGKKGLNFLVIAKPALQSEHILNPRGVFQEIVDNLKEIPREYEFRDFLENRKELTTLRLCKEYLQGELGVLRSLIVDNSSVPSFVNYIVTLIHEPNSPHLKNFKALINRTQAKPDIVYLNIIVLRLLFPVLFSKHPEIKGNLKTVFQKIYDRLNRDQDRSNESLESFDLENFQHLVLSSDHSDTESLHM